MSLEKILALTGSADADAPDLDAELLLAAQVASRELVLLLSDPDDDGDDDSSAKGDTDHDGGGGEHTSHATYKAMVKRNIPPKRAAAMCAKSDKNVKASQLAESLPPKPGSELTSTPSSRARLRMRLWAACQLPCLDAARTAAECRCFLSSIGYDPSGSA